MIERAASLLLLAACLAAWLVAAGARPRARVHLRFAAVLFAALAIAALGVEAAAPAIALLVLPIGSGVLVLGAAAGIGRPLEPALGASLLAVISLAALGATVSGLAALALGPAALCAGAIALLGGRIPDRLGAFQAIAAALCLIGAASAVVWEGAGPALTLFCAAGLLGVALALARSGATIEESAGRDLRGAIGPS